MTVNLLPPNNVHSSSNNSALMEKISFLANEISFIEEQKVRFMEQIEFLKHQDLDFLPSLLADEIQEKQLVHKVNATDLTGLSVAGVDGGLICKTFHNLDLVLTRAVACIFNYKKEGPAVQYLESEFPTPTLHHNFRPLNYLETDIFSSLERIKCEIDLATSIFDKASPEAILLDGSIFPLPIDRPNSLNFPRYK